MTDQPLHAAVPARVCVIIVNWNAGAWLVRCVESLQVQTLQPVQVLLVDNASTDDSLAQLLAKCSAWAPLRILQAGRNVGFAAGNNLALAECDSACDYVALLNPDAFAAPDWLERLVEAAHQHPEAAAWGSRQLCDHDPSVLDGTGDCYHLSGTAWRARHGQRQAPRDLRAREIFAPCAAAALYRRSVLQQLGGFDEHYFCYMEDVDLGFRLRLLGHSARYVPQAVVRHVGSATSGGQRSAFALFYGHRNMVWTFVKNMPLPLLLLLLPLHVMANLAVIFLYVLRGQPGPVLRAKAHALRGLPYVWRQRASVQRLTTMGRVWRALDKNWWPRP